MLKLADNRPVVVNDVSMKSLLQFPVSSAALAVLFACAAAVAGNAADLAEALQAGGAGLEKAVASWVALPEPTRDWLRFLQTQIRNGRPVLEPTLNIPDFQARSTKHEARTKVWLRVGGNADDSSALFKSSGGRDVEQGVTSEDLADSKWGQKIDSFFCPHLLSVRLERDSITESP